MPINRKDTLQSPTAAEPARGQIAHDDRDARTPRLSSTLELAELRAVLARDLATELRSERAVCDKGQRIECRRQALRALTCQRLANDCVDFARDFDSWKGHDPGSEVRRERSIAWIEFEQLSKKFLAKLSASVLEDVALML
jgi:hypothetical protein